MKSKASHLFWREVASSLKNMFQLALCFDSMTLTQPEVQMFRKLHSNLISLIFGKFFGGTILLGDQISWGPHFLGTKFPGDHISWGPNFLGTKFPRDQISRGPNVLGTKFLRDQKGAGPEFLGPKFLGDQISWGPKNSGAQMSSGTNSVTANRCNMTAPN